jgi:hypothetical protein
MSFPQLEQAVANAKIVLWTAEHALQQALQQFHRDHINGMHTPCYGCNKCTAQCRDGKNLSERCAMCRRPVCVYEHGFACKGCERLYVCVECGDYCNSCRQGVALNAAK